MKKFTLRLLSVVFISLVAFSSQAQRGVLQKPALQRCSTWEWYEMMFKADPAFKAEFEANQLLIAKLSAQQSSFRTAALVDTIPVVVHIVIANASTVTDATVQSQIDALNEDYRGLNADSTLIPAAFKPLYGKSGLFFMLAKQDPNGDPSNSIERRNNTVAIGLNANNENIKHFSTGGLDVWDPCRYLNIWVGADPQQGLLGSSVFPGTPASTVPGYVTDYRAFGRGASYLYAQYNKGRTATHEIGHFFNLRHIWGDDGGSCSGSDFPATIYGAGTDDTPNQAGETYGCATGVKTDACSPTAPGIMYQNFMDYTDDACMLMFTKGQNLRMDAALLFAPDRSCLLNSLTYQTPVLYANDAMIKNILNPAPNSQFCLTSVTPQFTLRNRGTNVLSSVRINVQLDNNPVVTTVYSTPLASGQEVVLNSATLTLAVGSHTLKVYTTLPSGVADQNPANDTARSTFIVGSVGGQALPLTENFETTAFPPNGWKVINPNAGSITWARRAGALGLPGNTGSAYMNGYNYTDQGQIDILHSPVVTVTGSDSLFVEFDNSYRQYDTDPDFQDTLQVVISTDCGQTFRTVWARGGDQLATVVPAVAGSWTPTLASQWVRRKINLTSEIPQGNIIVGFKTINGYGNNIYIDNVNIYRVVLPNRDITPVAFTEPFSTLCDGNNLRPALQVANKGRDTIRTFAVTYAINSGTPATVNFTGALPSGQTTTVQLNTISTLAVGTYNIVAYTSIPNGLPDQVPANDTIRFTFQVIAPVDAPLVEGFEGATFPPPNWQITQQPVDATTWRRTTLAGKNSTASAYMNNYNYASADRVDNLLTPLVRYSGADSVFLKFDVAATTYSFPGSTAVPLDTLEVLVTRDCGRTFTSIYKKYGSDLQTINDPNNLNTDEFIPRTNYHWRTDSINVTGLLGAANSIRFAFRNTENFENNIFLDNVNFTPKVVSAALKQKGYLITPNPFRNTFYIQHYLAPTDLRGFGVYNSVGQQVMTRSFSEGMAESLIPVNMGQLPAGMYVIKLMYSGKTISQKIIKMN